MKKQIEISKLMDSYTDDEFNIEGMESAGLQEVRSKVMEQVKNKKSLKLSKKLLIIAAAVVGVSAITAASLPHIFFRSGSGTMYEFDENNRLVDIKHGDSSFDNPPYTAENGKVYFTANNENIDITETLEQGKNYYYQYTDTNAEGKECMYIITVGGDIDDLGYGESVYVKGSDGFRTGGAGWYGGSTGEYYCYYKDGEVIMADSEEAIAECRTLKYPVRMMEKAWFLQARNDDNRWYLALCKGEEVDVSDTDGTVTETDQISVWHYPEGWTGERLSEDM